MRSSLEHGDEVRLYGLHLQLGFAQDAASEEVKTQIKQLQVQVNVYINMLHRLEEEGSELGSQQNVDEASRLLDWAGCMWKIIAKYEVLELLLDTNNRIKAGDAGSSSSDFDSLGFIDCLTKQSSANLRP